MSKTTNKFSPEVRERAVRLVLDNEGQHASRWQAVMSIAAKIGCTPQTLNDWVKKAEEGPRRNRHMHVLDLRVDMPAGQPGGPMRWRAELLQGGQDHPLPVGVRQSEPPRGREGDGEASCSPADQVEVLGDLLGAPERHGASDRDGATFQHIAHRFPGAAMVFKIGAHCCADPKRRLP